MNDFRTTVAANVGYLWKECHDLDSQSGSALCGHPIWGEVDGSYLSAIPEQAQIERTTVVTDFAYECFEDMYFGECLEQRPMSEEMLSMVRKRKAELGLTPPATCTAHRNRSQPRPRIRTALDVKPGDVVCLPPETDGVWEKSSTVWYAYVQKVHEDEDGDLIMDLLWLYRPADTTLGASYYPWQNELFLSDNCACSQYTVSAAIGKIEFSWHATDPTAERGFFVRSKFRTADDDDTDYFVSLKESDFHCECGDDEMPDIELCQRDHSVGDTVLVLVKGSLEPAQILEFDALQNLVRLKRLDRKERLAADVVPRPRPNELVLSNECLLVRPSKVIRACDVLYIEWNGIVPAPYNRDGAGDLFFVRRPAVHDATPEPVLESSTARETADEIPLNEGWNPLTRPTATKLRGMGIFCGGGNLDRGLEDAGAIEFDYAVDWDERAIHSYRANSRNRRTHYFLGSVHDYVARAVAGAGVNDPLIALPGGVEVLTAGSPCPGFSPMNRRKQSEQSLKNASMVASVISFVDIYSPQYLILENVINMTLGMGPNKDQNVFAQILAALVALGYQVKQEIGDAWSYGSCQARSRVFIIATAPGYTPLPLLEHTHAHPGDMRTRNLGKASNGRRFGERRDVATPFPHVSAGAACTDLTDITDGQVQLCSAFPDHRLPIEAHGVHRCRIRAVPTKPSGLGLARMGNLGRLTGEPKKFFHRFSELQRGERSTTYCRIPPKGLFDTFLTTLQNQNGIAGKALHWSQDRTISVMEARRGQGFLDHEVLLGTPPQQYKIIGNSVDRSMAFALGMALRRAWVKNNEEDDAAETTQAARATSEQSAVPKTQMGTETAPDSSLTVNDAQSVPIAEKEAEDEATQIQSRAASLSLMDAPVRSVLTTGLAVVRRILGSKDEDA